MNLMQHSYTCHSYRDNCDNKLYFHDKVFSLIIAQAYQALKVIKYLLFCFVSIS